jgi:4-hydroxy-tetrahydrodipicolinate synthase
MFSGSMVAMATPMDSASNLDLKALKKVIHFHLDNGTDALVVCGTTGESATLTFEEKKTVVKVTVAEVNGRIPVIAGSGAQGTQDAIELTQMVMSLGVDAALIMTPAYIKPTQEGLYQHYKAISANCALPIILYNVPGRTACDLSVDTAKRLSSISNIIGIKEASGLPERTSAILECCGESLDVYSGEDALTLELMRLGAKGVISVTANVAPKLMHDMCHAVLKKDFEEGLRIHEQLLPLHDALFSESNPIPTKWAMSELGLMEPVARLPLLTLSKSQREPLQAVMRGLSLL